MPWFAQFPVWLPAVAGVLWLLFLWGALHAGRRRRLLQNLPTCKTTGVFIGLVELKGTAEAEAPLISFLAGERCVHHDWSVQEHWSRTVQETYTDSKGKTRTRTRRESGWKTVADGGEQIPFYLRDDCGVVLVRPAGAKIEATQVFNHHCHPGDPLYYEKGPPHAIPDSDHRRRFVEHAVPLHTPVYVVGRARERVDVVAPEIAEDDSAPLFLISTREEEAIHRGLGWRFRILGVLSVLFGGAGAVTVGMIVGRGDNEIVIVAVLTGLFVLLAGALGWVWMVYNSLIDLRNRVGRAWAQVDVQLKRRFELIPRLLGVLKGLRDHERETQEAVATLRNQQAATAPWESGANHAACSRKLVALKEAYPELKSDEAFLRLQSELADTENRIALARGYYNEIATHFNTRITVVPDRWVAALARLRPRTLMSANDFERAPVKVNLAT